MTDHLDPGALLAGTHGARPMSYGWFSGVGHLAASCADGHCPRHDEARLAAALVEARKRIAALEAERDEGRDLLLATARSANQRTGFHHPMSDGLPLSEKVRAFLACHRAALDGEAGI